MDGTSEGDGKIAQEEKIESWADLDGINATGLRLVFFSSFRDKVVGKCNNPSKFGEYQFTAN